MIQIIGVFVVLSVISSFFDGVKKFFSDPNNHNAIIGLSVIIIFLVLISLFIRLFIQGRFDEIKSANEERDKKAREEEIRIKFMALIEKYGDQQIAFQIMKHDVWKGMSKEQLIESLGNPEEISSNVTKRKTIEIYKYGQTGKNRFDKRVTLEDGHVIGWQEK